MFELRTLGGLELLQTGDGAPRAIPMQAKRLALLAHLVALPPSSFRRRDTLLLLFWPELDQEHARGALRQALHFLRKTLGDGAILTRGEDEIGLDADLVRSDAKSLESALAAGDPEQALALYRGDFLEGVFVSDAAPELEDWISAERARLRGLAARAAWMAAEKPSNRDKVGELVRLAVQWSGDDEGALRRGLKVLDGMGDRAGAAALYDDFARRVARELDIQLSPETQRVIRELRARRASGSHPEPGAADPPATPSGTPTAAAAPTVPAVIARSPGRRMLLAGVAGALLVPALAAYMSPRRDPPRRAPEGVIEVTPFQVSDVDTSLAWMRNGIAGMLTIRLGGADSLGTGGRVDGTVTGTRQHLMLSASLVRPAGSPRVSRAMVAGPADSVAHLADRLAVQLLGMSAGMAEDRLTLLADASLPAVQLYIAGLAAARRADMETAISRYSQATDVDSTFTLAALQVCRSGTWTALQQSVRACRIARAGRDRLSPADRALLDAHPTEWASAAEMLTGLNAAVREYPDRPENWYALGDAHYAVGELSGEQRWAERAAEAYQRGWLVDSAMVTEAMGVPPVAEPMLSVVELAQMRHDTAEVVRLAASVLAVDSASDLARTLMWHRALVTNDSAREAFWNGIGSASQKVTMFIILFINWTGIGADDREHARAADAVRLRAHDPGYGPYALTIEALNGGRPDDVPREGPSPGYAANKVHRARIRSALSWDGDTAVALESVRLLNRFLETPASGEGARQQLFDACTVGEWQASHGEYAATAKALARLRQARVDSTMIDPGKTARYVSLCATLLDAMRASGLRLPGAREKVAAADSVAREFIFQICCGERVNDANIQIARLWEREGDLHAALRAVARRGERFRWAPLYMSTFLREEGRLAALTGDTARAVDAWRRYLMFRNNPQASLKPGVDSIRAQLAALESGAPTSVRLSVRATEDAP